MTETMTRLATDFRPFHIDDPASRERLLGRFAD
jgi:hypothetical protein